MRCVGPGLTKTALQAPCSNLVLRRLLATCLMLFFASKSVASTHCEAHPVTLDPTPDSLTAYSQGWGIDHRNTRYQSSSSIDSGNVDQLKLKWVYGLASQTPRSFPLITEDTVYIGDSNHGLVALDRETGCERWVYEHDGLITSAILPGNIDNKPVLVFADRFSGVYAVDVSTGGLIWHITLDEEPVPLYSGTPLVAENTVYVPIASMEVGLPVNPFYGCCTTSGGMAAFALDTGQMLWYLPTIREAARVTGRHLGFVNKYGPSGAPVWGAPSRDASRGLIFFGTGQNYTHPATKTSDAIFAVDAKTGEERWIRQFTENDTYTAACNISLKHPNCAAPAGPDVDFGAPTLLARTSSGRDILLAGQKSAEVHAMDPDTGEVLWTKRLGRGGIIGGVHHGLAVNESLGLVYVPISDKAALGFPSPGEPTPGLYALDIETGKLRWQYSRESRCADKECTYGLSSAITTTNDLVVTGNMDGKLEILNANNGQLLWTHDSWQDYASSNGVEVNGGSFDAHGPMVADDLLLVTSGYRYVGSQRGGNALLVFQLAPESAARNHQPAQQNHEPPGRRHEPPGRRHE